MILNKSYVTLHHYSHVQDTLLHHVHTKDNTEPQKQASNMFKNRKRENKTLIPNCLIFNYFTNVYRWLPSSKSCLYRSEYVDVYALFLNLFVSLVFHSPVSSLPDSDQRALHNISLSALYFHRSILENIPLLKNDLEHF